MVRRAPLRDPAIFRVGDYEIALRATQSRCIPGTGELSGHHHHGGGTAEANVGLTRFAVVGSPNSGKTTLFNAIRACTPKPVTTPA